MADSAQIKMTPSKFLEVAQKFYKTSKEYKKCLEEGTAVSDNPEVYISIGDIKGNGSCVGVSWYPEFDSEGNITNL